MYKGKGQVTAMPRNVHQLLNVNLIIHMKAEDEIVDKIYENIIQGKESFTLGRNEDLVRVDSVKIIEEPELVEGDIINQYNAYIPTHLEEGIKGINYRLNTTYHIENDLRKWDKIDVRYVEKHTQECLEEVLQDKEGDYVYWYQ